MRTVALIVAGLLLTGCAHRAKPTETAEAEQEAILAADRYEPVSASALTFDPPIVAQTVTPDLSRDGRQASAYVGYDQVITTYFYLHYDDRQVIQDGPERYERRAISHRFGVSYR